MSGIASLAIALWLQAKNQSTIGTKVFCGIGVLCLFLAFFFAWRKEHTAKTQKEQEIALLSKPDFVLELSQSLSVHDPSRDATMVFMTVKVINRGAESSVVGWTIHYKSRTLDEDVQWFYMAAPIRFNNGGQLGTIQPTESIADRTVKPIVRGGFAHGRLPILVPGNRVEEIATGASEVTVTTSDAFGNQFSGVYRGGRAAVEHLVHVPAGT